MMVGPACGPEVSLASQGADAEVYVRAWCEDRLDKSVECAAHIPEGYEEFTVADCIETQTAQFDDPCFAEKAEFFRCRHERLSCQEYFDPNIQTPPGSACYDFRVLVLMCFERHPESGDDG